MYQTNDKHSVTKISSITSTFNQMLPICNKTWHGYVPVGKIAEKAVCRNAHCSGL